MSPTTVAKLEIEPLPHPDGASPGLNAVIDAVEEHINRSNLLLAAGYPGSGPDFIDWLDGKKLPGRQDLDTTKDKSDLVEKYSDRQQEVKDWADELDRKNNDIDTSKIAAFKTSNDTYQNIEKIVRELRDTLENAPDPRKGEDDIFRLAPADEVRLLSALLDAAERVHDEIETAAKSVDNHVRDIEGSFPNVPRRFDTDSGGVPAAPNAYNPAPASNASYRITDPDDPVGTALRLAGDQIGVSENDAAFRDKPYNNGSAWCAAFTSWLWKEAGYDVSWTDFDYVPAVWNDAVAMDLNRASTSQAQPGDLIVFDWEGDGTPDHIGIVDSVANGTINTIEGNSSDRVQRQHYGFGAGEIVGVIKPPPTASEIRH